MSLAMTVEKRQAFLAQVHVAVVAVADEDGRAPLAVPIWYDYRPGGEVALITEWDSRKTTLIRHAGRITLCVQGTALPYQYASADGPITTTLLETAFAAEQHHPGPASRRSRRAPVTIFYPDQIPAVDIPWSQLRSLAQTAWRHLIVH